MNTLDRILETKRDEVRRAKARGLPEGLSDAPRGFARALAEKPGHALIAEIKKASPSKGLIRADFDPPAHARAYEAGGAACLSVLTDERYFQGHPSHLQHARAACALPILRKDFTIDPWQAAEARAMGADAILLIAAALDDTALAECEAAALEQGLDVFIEVHDPHELDRALRLKSRLIGVNNRDLRDFSVDPARTIQIARLAPPDVALVAESGLQTNADLEALAEHNVRRFLVGEALMRQPDIKAATQALLTPPPPGEATRDEVPAGGGQ